MEKFHFNIELTKLMQCAYSLKKRQTPTHWTNWTKSEHRTYLAPSNSGNLDSSYLPR